MIYCTTHLTLRSFCSQNRFLLCRKYLFQYTFFHFYCYVSTHFIIPLRQFSFPSDLSHTDSMSLLRLQQQTVQPNRSRSVVGAEDQQEQTCSQCRGHQLNSRFQFFDFFSQKFSILPGSHQQAYKRPDSSSFPSFCHFINAVRKITVFNAYWLSSLCQLSRFIEISCYNVFHVPVFSGYCNRDYVLLHSESIQGLNLAFLQVRIYISFISHFLSSICHTSPSPISRLFFLLVIPFHPTSVIVTSGEK